MDSATLKKDAENKARLVDERLLEFLSRDEPVENLHDGLLYALGLDAPDRETRGKRVRPVLCLQSCEALGGNAERAMPFACAIELVHNFCLIHDDIEDGDEMRRGRPSAWVRYGVPHAINTGDYMLTKVFMLLTDAQEDDQAGLNRRLLRLISETLDHTHIGQALDMNARGNREFTVEDYLRIAREKTGYYLAAPILGGAMAAGATDSALEALRQFGQFVGPLFQVIDDLIDLTEGKGRGEIGSDIREGKRSYLAAIAAGRAAPEERNRLFDILDLPRAKTTPELVSEAIGILQKHRALDAAREYARLLHAEAMKTLGDVPRGLAELLAMSFEGLAKRTR